MVDINWSQSVGGMSMFSLLFVAVFIWDTIWKFIAMWKAAKKHSLAWFIILGVVNSIGILPILYIHVFSKIRRKLKEEVKPKRRHRRTSRRKRRR